MGGDAFFHKVDVTNPESVEELVQAAVEKFGRLDIMVNNAGRFENHGAVRPSS
jgi:NAD(P)-dependent dehydrogenase (short-subunit alcohol dehydrogenase family)